MKFSFEEMYKLDIFASINSVLFYNIYTYGTK